MAGKGDRRRPASKEGQKNWDDFWDGIKKIDKILEKANATEEQRDEEEHTDGERTT
jgi:hypothetical protein